MPSPKFKEEIDTIKNDALASMQIGRKNYAPIRAVKRFWKYKDGKRKLARVGIATVVTTGGVIAGALTHGAALPIIAGIAAGQYAVGKVGDSFFMSVYGNEYKGATRTREFIENYTGVDFDTHGEATRLATRAHTTIRRACQHYRKGWNKLDKLKQKAGTPVKSCDDAAERLTLLWQAKRHFDKAWLYIHPAYYLSKAMFDFYKSYRDFWRGEAGPKVEDRFSQLIVDAMGWHEQEQEGQRPCLSELCYWETRGAMKGFPPPYGEHLWNHPHWRENKLNKTKKLLNIDPTLELPSIEMKSDDTKYLYQRTRDKYLGKRSVLTKVKHKVTNPWDKKTKSEKVAFGVGQGLGVGLAAGGVGVPDFGVATAVVVGYAGEVLETGGDYGIETAAETGAKALNRRPTQVRGAAVAKEGQESLQKAAIHLWEAAELVERLPKWMDKCAERVEDGDVCSAVVDIIAETYKLKHHLVKTQEPLEEAIEMVAECVKALTKDFKNLKKGHNQVVSDIEAFMKTNTHQACKKEHCLNAS